MRDRADAANAAQDAASIVVERACPNCPIRFKVRPGRGSHKQFCSTKCRLDFRARCGVRGKVLMPYALAWHAARCSSRGPMKLTASFAFREMGEMLRDWAREDAAAGRPKLSDYMDVIISTGIRYGDRKRR